MDFSVVHKCQNCGKCEDFKTFGEGAIPLPKVAHMQTCGGCRAAHYCGKVCQMAHWATHKGACRERQAANAKGKAEPGSVVSRAYGRWIKESRKMLVRMAWQAQHGKEGPQVLWLDTEYCVDALDRGEQDVVIKRVCLHPLEDMKTLMPELHERIQASPPRSCCCFVVVAAEAGARIIPVELTQGRGSLVEDMLPLLDYVNLLNMGAGDVSIGGSVEGCDQLHGVLSLR